jgi:hypothetical protein
MRRASVVVLSDTLLAVALVNDLLEEMRPDERAVGVDSARTCIATLSCPVRRRMLIIDGAPPDLGAGPLIEAIRLVDPAIPIVFIRHGWEGPPTVHNAVYVQPGPLVSSTNVLLLERLLGTSVMRH